MTHMAFLTGKALPRRTVLRGLGATVALPLLDAMFPASVFGRTAPKRIHRFQAVYVPNGMAMEYWTPKGEGKDFEISPIMEPLAPFRDQMLVLSGLDREKFAVHAGASGSFLTGAPRGGDNETDLLADVSVDQLIARELGKETQLPSLEVSMDPAKDAGSCEVPTLDHPGFRNSRELGGGAFLDVGSYTFFTAVSLLGKLPTGLKVEMEYQDDEVDRSGVAHLRFDTSQQGYLSWGYHRAYRAELMVWGENQSLYADRIFSKNDDYVSSVMLRDVHGKETGISIEPANSFVEMFKAIHSAIHNQTDRETLYNQAERQAEIMKMACDVAETYR